jgi:hypothetical protein
LPGRHHWSRSIQARFSDRKLPDLAARIVLAAFSLTVIFHPSTPVAVGAIVPMGLFLGYWLQKRRKIALQHVLPAAGSAGSES